jgi:hypothetical protein
VTPFERWRQERTRQRLDAAIREPGRMVIGSPIDITPERKVVHTMINPKQSAAVAAVRPAPLPADAAKAREQIAAALGLAAGVDDATLLASVEALLDAVDETSPEGIEEEGRRHGLSAHAIRAIKATRGGTVRGYLQAKKWLGR